MNSLTLDQYLDGEELTEKERDISSIIPFWRKIRSNFIQAPGFMSQCIGEDSTAVLIYRSHGDW
ncbi:hypothetical protein HW132_07995 [Brasilonema sp. CT11]|nr:hypothetical protein [Brasilonema sp. CT11]